MQRASVAAASTRCAVTGNSYNSQDCNRSIILTVPRTDSSSADVQHPTPKVYHAYAKLYSLPRCKDLFPLVPKIDLRTEPTVEMASHEVIIVQMRISGIDAIDFLKLTRAKSHVGIETPDALEQTLASQDFVEASDAAGKPVAGVEKCGIGIGNFYGAPQ